ncbi:MAG TPA: DoxX family protein [Vicinamibacterales bacterium]|jgi:putative oxidoreductase|nr:DoxX family protein [Vicinamibacterales bacterium]
MRSLHMLGRAVFGGFFIYNGLNHLMNPAQLGQYAAAKGVPSPDVAVQATGALMLAGGVSVLTGLKPRQGLMAIVGFLLPVSLRMHRFWEEQDPAQRTIELVNFTKNMALVGAALALMELREPWPLSLDEARNGRPFLPSDDEEMFIRLGERELRALPA